MSSAVGTSAPLHHGAAGAGDHVHAPAGASGGFTHGVVPPPFNAPFSMAQHFAALTCAHAAASQQNGNFGGGDEMDDSGAPDGTVLFPPGPAPTTTNLSAPMVFGIPDVVGGAAAMTSGGSKGAELTNGVASASKGDKGDSLKQMQKRLLLLRHASRCEAQGETCTATRHCRGMKELWSHLNSCSDPRCQTAHCVSSRYVLSHYHRCQDSKCALCAPVREAIAKSRRGRGAGPCE